MNRWREYLITLIFAVLSALVVRNYILTAYKVPTGSMQPTLKPGDFIFSSRLSYGLVNSFFETDKKLLPKRGDLVVFSYSDHPNVPYLKRIIGLPGDRIQILNGRILLNEKPFEYNLMTASEDNPNPDLFEIYEETSIAGKWKVILKKKPQYKDFGPLIVPPGEVFLLGDNRDASDDSRYWGTVPVTRLLGEVLLIWLSLDWNEGHKYPSVRWNRVFSTVH